MLLACGMKSPWKTPLPLIGQVILLLGLWTAGTTAAEKKHPLWKIQGPNCTVYLAGSVHFLKKEHYPLPPPLEAAFAQAKIAVFEMDIGETETVEFQTRLMSKAMLPPGQTLSNQLSASLYERLEKQAGESGLPMETLQSFKPGMVALMLVMVELQRMKLDPKLGLDQHFYARAKKAKKEIRGLEAAQFQVDMLMSFSRKEGEAMLDSTLQDLKHAREELNQMLTAWQTGDMNALAGFMNKAFKEHPEIYKRLLVDRNKSWVPQIEALLRGSDDAIVIVGAGHLAGKDSVVELLEKNGAKVVQQ
jgi:uncharacterized protein YbaP (TraB family)